MNTLQAQLETKSNATSAMIKECQESRMKMNHEKAKILVCVMWLSPARKSHEW